MEWNTRLKRDLQRSVLAPNEEREATVGAEQSNGRLDARMKLIQGLEMDTPAPIYFHKGNKREIKPDANAFELDSSILEELHLCFYTLKIGDLVFLSIYLAQRS